MNRPKGISAEQKQREAALVRSLIASSPYNQEEVANYLGTKQTAISQWLVKNAPTAIPDYQYLRLAELLGFDPSETRPWLFEMYILSDRVFSKIQKIKGSESIVSRMIMCMTPEELLKVSGALEETARRMLRANSIA